MNRFQAERKGKPGPGKGAVAQLSTTSDESGSCADARTKLTQQIMVAALPLRNTELASSMLKPVAPSGL